jgi:hypothetical protein
MSCFLLWLTVLQDGLYRLKYVRECQPPNGTIYKVVQIWPGLFVWKQVTVCPGHIWTTLYICHGWNELELYIINIGLMHGICMIMKCTSYPMYWLQNGVVFSFIHLADYMILHLLYVLSRNSLEDLVNALHTHYHFLPSDTRLCNVQTYDKLEDTRPADAPQVRWILEYSFTLGYYLTAKQSPFTHVHT